MKNASSKKKVGVLVIATGKYILFVSQLFRSIKKFFLKDHDVTVFVFTDDITKAPAGTVPLYQKHLPWPGASIRRYSIFNKYKALLSQMDYLYYIDADMTVASEIKEDILGDLVGTQHSEEAGRDRDKLPYDRNKNSLACVPAGTGSRYFCGGFNGGKSDVFLRMSETLAANVETDLKNGIVAKNYDESHLNRYFADNPPTVILDTTYCWIKSIKEEPHIIAIVKDHGYYRGCGSDSKLDPIVPGGVKIINYSNIKYRQQQQRLCAALSAEGIDDVLSFNQEAIENSPFWTRHKKILSEERGGGYWLWKPYIIIETMKTMKDYEVLLYMDSGDMARPGKGLVKFVEKTCAELGGLLILNSGSMKQFCKRDAFVLTNCDTKPYHDMSQLEAGIIGLVKNEATTLMLAEWFRYCQNPMILTDSPSTQGTNFPEFADHRHDQAILSLMVKKHEFKVTPIGSVMAYVIHNYDGAPLAQPKGKTAAPTEPPIESTWDARLKKLGLPAGFDEMHPLYEKIPSYRAKLAQIKKEFEYK